MILKKIAMILKRLKTRVMVQKEKDNYCRRFFTDCYS